MSTNSAASTAAKHNLFSGHAVTHRRLPVIRSCFLLSGLLLAGGLAIPAAAVDPADTCAPPAGSEPVVIRHVHDGDTVFLDNGEKVRLIGLDTPELGRDNRPPDPGAVEARDRLRELIGQGDGITLRRGVEKRDKYGRLLAHVYADGRNLQAELLAAGLATPLFIAPNLGHVECYRQAAERARTAGLGIWQLPQYRPRPAASLTGHERGYHIVTGTVQRVGRSHCCIWLNLDDDMALRIERKHLSLFEGSGFENIEGHRVEARGYVYKRNNELRMQIRHPADLVIGP